MIIVDIIIAGILLNFIFKLSVSYQIIIVIILIIISIMDIKILIKHD